MASQNNTGRQFDRRHAVTIEAQAVLAPSRMVGYDGLYATSAGGVKDCQGVTQSAAEIGQAVALTTGYSELVEASVAITFGAYIKPAADGSGRAAVGTIADHCGRALGAASGAGVVFEMEIKPHVHA